MTKVYVPFSSEFIFVLLILNTQEASSLMQKLAHDLRTTLSPVYPSILKRLLKLLPRSLEPAALTVLLETLSSLFRYLLVPSIHTELITHSWNAVRLVLPKCLPEIQRAIAEVWGSVLRRLKSASRDHAVNLLAENAEGLEDASAWAVVFASKVRSLVFSSLSRRRLMFYQVNFPNIAYLHRVHLYVPFSVLYLHGEPRRDIHGPTPLPDSPHPSRQECRTIFRSGGPFSSRIDESCQ